MRPETKTANKKIHTSPNVQNMRNKVQFRPPIWFKISVLVAITVCRDVAISGCNSHSAKLVAKVVNFLQFRTTLEKPPILLRNSINVTDNTIT